MKVQCSIKSSAMRSLTESPMRALQGNQDYPVLVFCQASARSGVPSFNIATIDGVTPNASDPTGDAMAMLRFYLTHHWEEHFANQGPDQDLTYDFIQEDYQDKDTFLGASAVLKDEYSDGSYPGQFWWNNGNHDGVPIWNFPQSYFRGDDPLFISIGRDIWDYNPTFDAMRAAVNAVDFTKFWAGVPEHDTFQYDRATTGSPSGLLLPISNGAAIQGLATPVSQTSTGIGYSVGQSISQAQQGIISPGQMNYFRMQVQIRNFVAQIPIEYNFVERVQVSNRSFAGQPAYDGGIANGNIAVDLFYLPRGGDFFTKDNQIVEVPLPLLGNPPVAINTPFGTRIAYRSDVFIIVGNSARWWAAQNKSLNRLLTSL